MRFKVGDKVILKAVVQENIYLKSIYVTGRCHTVLQAQNDCATISESDVGFISFDWMEAYKPKSLSTLEDLEELYAEV